MWAGVGVGVGVVGVGGAQWQWQWGVPLLLLRSSHQKHMPCPVSHYGASPGRHEHHDGPLVGEPVPGRRLRLLPRLLHAGRDDEAR